uniref:[histone H3]-lysine(27) N-trimethyltransferase n=1 Tax=Haemonchus contortus TaxID=6289 RepID=A0A7I4Y882_HAECO
MTPGNLGIANEEAYARQSIVSRRPVGRPRKSNHTSTPEEVSNKEQPAAESPSGRGFKRKTLLSSTESLSSSTISQDDVDYKPPASLSSRTAAAGTTCVIKRRRRGRPRKQGKTEPASMTVSSPSMASRLTVAADEPSSSRGRKRKTPVSLLKKKKEITVEDEKNKMELDDSLSDLDCDSSVLDESLLCLGSDDEFEDERLLDEAFLKKCGRRVMEVYFTVIKDYNDRIRKEEAPNFAKIIKKLPLRRYHTYDDSTPTKLVLEPDDLSEFITHFKITDCRNMNAQRCGVRFLPALELRPRTAYWVHTECNIRADEEHRLSHIPFVSEDHDDKQFCAELRKLYDEGIHGADRGCDKYINDYIMFNMLEILKQDWEDRSNSEKIMDHIYYAIFKLFPNKLSHRQLVTARGDLEERFAPGRTPSKSTQELRSRSDQNFHSVNVLCCERCYQYDCVLHGPYDEEVKPFKRRQGERAPRPKPCGPHCHLNDAQSGKQASDCHYFLNVSNGMCDKKQASSRSPSSPRSRNRQLNGFTDSASSNVLNGQISNGKVSPFANPTLMNILVALLAGEQTSTCLITAQMNMICQDIGVPSKTCSEIHRLASQLAQTNASLTPEHKKVSVKDKHRSFRSFTWADGKGQVENKERMVPCSHSGHCDGNSQCVCSSASGICSKFCGCPPDCRMRFPGCRCAPGNCRTKQCQCYFARWECDPDLCKSCKCDDLSMDGEKCRNVPLQRGHQKLLKVGISGIAGWGCFIQETADKGDLIAEYTGEVISKWESERRGLIYDKFCTSYIFGMNNDQFIDATRVGNLIRFANHSNNNANCSSEIKIVNGEHRIGVYASRHILFGEELLFDYNYGQTWNKFVPIEKSIKAQANRSTPDSDSSRTAGSQSKPDKLRRTVLKKSVKAELKTSDDIAPKKEPKPHDDSLSSTKLSKQRMRLQRKA